MALTVSKLIGDCWHCSHCDALIYNLKYIDGDWYPVAGAPPAHYLTVSYPRVCSICFFLWTVIGENAYWVKLEEEHKDKKSKAMRLRPGADYFGW